MPSAVHKCLVVVRAGTAHYVADFGSTTNFALMAPVSPVGTTKSAYQPSQQRARRRAQASRLVTTVFTLTDRFEENLTGPPGLPEGRRLGLLLAKKLPKKSSEPVQDAATKRRLRQPPGGLGGLDRSREDKAAPARYRAGRSVKLPAL